MNFLMMSGAWEMTNCFKQVIILSFFLFCNIARANTITLISEWGTNQNLINYFDRAQDIYQELSPNALIIVHTKDPKEFAREVNFKFLINNQNLIPDIFSMSYQLINMQSNSILNLKNYINFGSIFHPVANKIVSTYHYKVFPLEISTIVIFYNKKIFNDIGVAIPHNSYLSMNQFIQIVWKIRASWKYGSISPIVIGLRGDDFFKISNFIFSILLRFLGPEKFSLMIQSKIDWNDEEIIRALNLSQYLFRLKNMFNQDHLEISDIEARKRFSEKKAAMYISETSYLQSNYRPTALGVMPFFNITNKNVKGNQYMFLNISKGLCVSQLDSTNTDVFQFLKKLNHPQLIQHWNREIKTLCAFNNSNFQGVSIDILNYLNNSQIVSYYPKFREISVEYYLDIMDMFYKIISKNQTDLSLEIKTLLNQFHNKVKKNGWYRK